MRKVVQCLFVFLVCSSLHGKERRLETGDDVVTQVQFDGDSVLTSSGTSVHLWTLTPDISQRVYYDGAVRLERVGDFWIAVSARGVEVLRAADQKITDRFKDIHKTGPIVSRDGNFVFIPAKTGDLAGALSVFRIDESGKLVDPVELAASRKMRLCLASPDGKWIVGIDNDRRMWKWASSKRGWNAADKPELLNGLNNGIDQRSGSVLEAGAVSYSRKNDLVAVGGTNESRDGVHSAGVIDIWSCGEWRYVRTVQPYKEGHVSSIAFSHDGKLMAVGGGQDLVADSKPQSREERFAIKLFSTTDYSVVGELKGHRETVRALAFSQDDHLLVSGSRDMSAIVWELSSMRAQQPR